MHIIATNDQDVVSVENNITKCDLGSMNYSLCVIKFQIIAQGKNGTYPFVVEGEVEFKTECQLSV